MTDAFGALIQALDLQRSEDGPLSGLSFVVKDNIDVEGYVCGNGEPAFAESHAPAARSAPAVERLLAAGARLVGKAHMDEMAYSLLGANPHYGTPVNPNARDRHPGGSSSGSAVAVAAGLADFALGTDTAGSCRAPASFCGVYGFRPSHGTLARTGVVPLAPSFDTIGWFARDADTLDRVGEILLPEGLEPVALDQGALLTEAFAACPQQEASLFLAASAALGESPSLRELALGEEFWSRALAHFRNFQAYEAHRSQGAWIAQVRPALGPGVAERFVYAAGVTEAQKQAADAFRKEARRRIDELLGSSGFFVAPTTPFFAPELDERAEALDDKRYRMMRLFLIASFFGLPQVSLPLKTCSAPLGLSLIGPRWSDRALLTRARQLAARHSSVIAETRRP